MNSNGGGAVAPAVPTTTCGQLREYCGPFCMNKWTQKILLLSVFAIFLIFMQILNVSGVNVYVLGILPRTPEGLAGLIGMPWVHVNWKHLVGNLLGWYLLGFLVLLHGRRVFVLLYLFCSIVGGFVVWIVARPVRHVGLSGVIFGFFGFLLFAAVWERPVKCTTVIGLIVAIFIYGGTMLSGVLIPNMEVSWEGHVCGFVAGGAWAFWYFKFLLYNPRFCAFIGKEPLSRGDQLPTSTAAPPVADPSPAGSQPLSKGGSWWQFGSGAKSRAAAPPAAAPPPLHNPTYSAPAPSPASQQQLLFQPQQSNFTSAPAYPQAAPTSAYPSTAYPTPGGNGHVNPFLQ